MVAKCYIKQTYLLWGISTATSMIQIWYTHHFSWSVICKLYMIENYLNSLRFWFSSGSNLNTTWIEEEKAWRSTSEYGASGHWDLGRWEQTGIVGN